ncbi:MAG TPA: succinate dehydrogenase cytochrome b subunit, partial [Polyangiaceae bacterium]|nr:succinate dehydrogenase cytochrome b subunit [Polyangiaceae bacterium]
MIATSTSGVARFGQSLVGKKVILAVTGVILIGYLVTHIIGNMQVFKGAKVLDGYAEYLHHQAPALVWLERVIVFPSLFLHAIVAAQVSLQNAKARPQKYAKVTYYSASFASRMMIWAGLALLLFFVYHILHFTTGQAHADFQDVKPYHNMVSAFSNPLVTLLYVVSMVFLGMHLSHGLWSLVHSLGLTHNRRLKPFATLTAVALSIGFIIIPIAVMIGAVPPEESTEAPADAPKEGAKDAPKEETKEAPKEGA